MDAMTRLTPVPAGPQPNGDEDTSFNGVPFIGNFHKSLAHNEFGEVDASQYETFRRICDGTDPVHGGDFEGVDKGPLSLPPHQTPLPPSVIAVAKLTSPQAGRATERLGPNPADVNMPPPPGVLSNSTAAEMTELLWMARLRDVPFDLLPGTPDFAEALSDVRTAMQLALDNDDAATQPGRLRLGTDLPSSNGVLDLTPNTLFRCGLKDEDKGPLVSQFFLHDINYGAQLIKQTQVPYRAGRDYLTEHRHWLLAQNTGFDENGDAYNQDNDYMKDPAAYEDPPAPDAPLSRFRIRNMRDLARFVNRDALHQAYFNAALQLLNWGAKADEGNPYKTYKRQAGFATLGGPNLLSLVSEVASRALKVVWRQKWLVNRRLRPEAYGGLMQMQKLGYNGTCRNYGLPAWVFETMAAQRSVERYGTHFLPIAFSAGSPTHPAYGAGHATVAGACVTILKAWFDEDEPIKPLMQNAPQLDPVSRAGLWQPANHPPGGDLPLYTGADGTLMTVGGELNKLACNVAMGRSMGGVHWRSDNTRSLRLGEQIATIILKRQNKEYAEQPFSLSYTNFDGNHVTIQNGVVTVDDDPELTAFYAKAEFA